LKSRKRHSVSKITSFGTRRHQHVVARTVISERCAAEEETGTDNESTSHQLGSFHMILPTIGDGLPQLISSMTAAQNCHGVQHPHAPDARTSSHESD
jgi:hypothetical protein